MIEEIRARLAENSDAQYRLFQAKLMPTVAPERILGVRTPILRKFAKEIAGEESVAEFLNDLPHRYYDENNLHGFVISLCKDYEKTVRAVDAFLPYVDNWATCDLLSPVCFKKNRAALRSEIDRWLSSDKVYTVRFGIEMLMSHYLDEDFDPAVLKKVAAVHHGDYYVKMMAAWFFATALAKQWDAAVPYIESKQLDGWVQNKTIQKAVESYRITAEQKDYLRSFKVKRAK